MLEPPKDHPERLFRALLAVPRATAPIAYRLRDVPAMALGVRAITSLEVGEAAAWTEEAPAELHASRFPQAIMAAALTVGGRLAFSSPEDVGQLDESEIVALGSVVLDALSRISPTWSRSNADAWIDALAKGARHPSNMMSAVALGGSVDTSIGFSGSAVTPRPDRYFGLRLGELTDGHWFAYRAARRVIEGFQGKNG